MKSRFIIPILLLLSLESSQAAEVAATRPTAGVTFRTDDNGLDPQYFLKRAEVFDKYGLKYGAAVNLLAAESQPGMIENFRTIQGNGHDIMDHTPNHDNLFLKFTREDDIAWVRSLPGVDHLTGKTAYLSYKIATPPAGRESRQVNVNGKSFTPVVTEGAYPWFKSKEFVYFPTTQTVYRFQPQPGTQATFELKSPWGEDNVNLPESTNVPLQLLETHEIFPTPEAIGLLAQTVRRVCERNRLKPPVTYCAPGNAPRLTREAVKAVYGDQFGYRSGCVYPNQAAKVFNEPDPNSDAAFAMQWGQVYDDNSKVDLAAIKSRIADLVATNTVVIVGSHVVKNPGEWPEYFAKLDALLAWLKEKNIPQKSHADWADLLYRSGTRLTGNIFPSLDRDLNEDGRPDGLQLLGSKLAPAPAEAGLPEVHVLTAQTPGPLFRVQALGGLPHGAAQLSCWLNGPVGAKVDAKVFGVGSVSFTLKEGWNKYTAPITVPTSISTARVDFNWSSPHPGSLSVAGIAFSSANSASFTRVPRSLEILDQPGIADGLGAHFSSTLLTCNQQ